MYKIRVCFGVDGFTQAHEKGAMKTMKEERKKKQMPCKKVFSERKDFIWLCYRETIAIHCGMAICKILMHIMVLVASVKRQGHC